MKPLHEIANDILLLLDTVDGELPPDLDAQLDALQGDIETKLERCCAVVRQMDAERDALKEESARFALRAQHADNAAKHFKEYMKSNLERLGIDKMEAGLFKIRIQNNSQPAVHFDGDAEKLPETFRRVEYSIDSKAIVTAWKAEQELPSGVEVVRGRHLRIA